MTLATILAESGARPGYRAAGLRRRARRIAFASARPRVGGARMPRVFLHRQAFGRKKDNVRPLHMFERAIAIRDDGQQTLAIFGGRKDTDGLSHTHRIAHLPASVNHPTVSVH